ncbi:hypothetical protein JCGZ_16679 [Jatropha curcas]|uniref:Uncharacterized protein n=2 Tax=Jatropha curcas TaxID=180498 RepID=A0A067KDV6_JATCU|nr:hypothetical protein JCGZ_16679 [Jatropha curcas]
MQSELYLEDNDNRDWMSLVPPPSANTGSPVDVVEDWGAGFDDFEIFDGLKEFK